MSPRNRDKGNGVHSRQDIWELIHDPMLRWPDVPGGEMLAEQAICNPDPYLHGLVELVAQDQMSSALSSACPFWPNYPPKGELPPMGADSIPVAALLPTQDVLSLPISDLTRNLILAGPTGSGKTTLLHTLILACLANPNCLVIAFDRKQGELIDCATLTASDLPVWVLRPERGELEIAMLQPPPNVHWRRYCTTIVDLIASQFHLWASRRLMHDTLTTLFQRPRPAGQWPALSEWISMIENIRVHALSRIGQYREACLFVLKQLYNELGQTLNHTSSNFFERAFCLRGCVVVLTDGLSTDTAAFLSGLYINYLFHNRRSSDPDSLNDVIFVLDDSLPMLKGTGWESEGGTNPLAEFSFMSRSRRMGFVCSVQNFSAISPAFKNNAQSILCFGSYGRDAEELARHLNLTREQVALLPMLRPGQLVACLRSVWPLPVYGVFPELP